MPKEALPILREESLNGDPEHMLFDERASACRCFIAGCLERAPDVGQRTGIRGLAQREWPIDERAPAVLFDQLLRDHACVCKNLIGR